MSAGLSQTKAASAVVHPRQIDSEDALIEMEGLGLGFREDALITGLCE